MKRSHIIGALLFVAVAVLGSSTAASASVGCLPEGRNQQPKYDTQRDCVKMENATMFGYWYLGLSANWLVDGSLITEAEGSLATESEEEFELGDLKTSFGTVSVLCHAILHGTVAFEGKDQTTEVLDLEGHKIELGSTALLCTSTKTCETSGAVEVWPENLPWTTEVSLMTSAPEFVDNAFGSTEGKEPGWTIKCSILGTKVEDICEGPETAGVENIAEGKTLEALSPEADETKANCTQGGKEAGDLAGESLTLLTSGKALTVSE